MSIGASVLNLELSRPHDTFMAQIQSAWKFITQKGLNEELEEEQGEEPEVTEQ